MNILTELLLHSFYCNTSTAQTAWIHPRSQSLRILHKEINKPKKQALTFVIEVIDVRWAGDLGDEPGGAVGPTDKTVPVRRTHFIYSQKRKEEVNVQNMYRTWNHWNHLIRGLFKLVWGGDRSKFTKWEKRCVRRCDVRFCRLPNWNDTGCWFMKLFELAEKC